MKLIIEINVLRLQLHITNHQMDSMVQSVRLASSQVQRAEQRIIHLECRMQKEKKAAVEATERLLQAKTEIEQTKVGSYPRTHSS